MNIEAQRAKAETFFALHVAESILILINAWDVASAKLFELEGCPAIATSSAAVAATLGHADGERMSLAENVQVVRHIAHACDLPVSCDMEAGYADSAEGVAASAYTAMKAGAIGLNLEDSTHDQGEGVLIPAEAMAERIAAIRTMAEGEAMPFFINARTDVFLGSSDNTPTLLDETIRRAAIYRAAGADGIFIPDMGNLDGPTIGKLAKAIDAPLNVIGGPHLPPIKELESLGVARVSLGPRHYRIAMTVLRDLAREVLNEGTYDSLASPSMSYAEMNQMFKD